MVGKEEEAWVDGLMNTYFSSSLLLQIVLCGINGVQMMACEEGEER